MQRSALSRPSTAFTCLLFASFFGTGAAVGCARSERRLGGARSAGVVASSRATATSAPDASAVLLCTALHELPARRRAECCAEAPVSLYFDECVRLLSSAVRAGRLRIDGREVATCAASVDTATRGCDWVAPTLAAAPTACAGATTGLVTAGGRCASSLECAGALHCAGQGATTPGVCRPPEPAGAACGASVDALATYLGVRGLEARKPACAGFCALAEHRCEEKPAEGAPCRVSVNCDADQICANGRCVPRAHGVEERGAVAATCATDLDCAAGGCVAGADGARTCGRKCSRELTVLRPGVPENTPARALALPAKGKRPAP